MPRNLPEGNRKQRRRNPEDCRYLGPDSNRTPVEYQCGEKAHGPTMKQIGQSFAVKTGNQVGCLDEEGNNDMQAGVETLRVESHVLSQRQQNVKSYITKLRQRVSSILLETVQSAAHEAPINSSFTINLTYRTPVQITSAHCDVNGRASGRRG